MVLSTLTVTPCFVLTRTREARVIESNWRQGSHRVATVTPHVIRRWMLAWTNDPSGTQRAIVQAKWDAMCGPCGVFEWTPPGGSATAVRFAMEDFEPVQRSAAVHGFSIELEEALNHDG